MRDRSNVLMYFEQFRTLCKTQYIQQNAKEKLVLQSTDTTITSRWVSPEIEVLQCDNAKEFEKLASIILTKYGTHTQYSNVHTPQQNGVAERRMRTVQEKMRALLFHAKLPGPMWGEAVLTTTYLLNRTSTKAISPSRTPYELWYNKKPDLNHLKVFGCTAYVHIPAANRNKLQPNLENVLLWAIHRTRKDIDSLIYIQLKLSTPVTLYLEKQSFLNYLHLKNIMIISNYLKKTKEN